MLRELDFDFDLEAAGLAPGAPSWCASPTTPLGLLLLPFAPLLPLLVALSTRAAATRLAASVAVPLRLPALAPSSSSFVALPAHQLETPLAHQLPLPLRLILRVLIVALGLPGLVLALLSPLLRARGPLRGLLAHVRHQRRHHKVLGWLLLLLRRLPLGG